MPILESYHRLTPSQSSHFSPAPSPRPVEPTSRAPGRLQRAPAPGRRPRARTARPVSAPGPAPPPPPPRRPGPAPSPGAPACAAAEMARAGRAPRRRRRRGPSSSLGPPAPPTPGHAVTGAEAAAAAAAAERRLRLAARNLLSCARGARLRRGAPSPRRRAPSRRRSEVGGRRILGRAWGRRRISGDSSAQSSLAGVQALPLPLCSAPRPGGRWTRARGLRPRSPAWKRGAGWGSPSAEGGLLRLGCCETAFPNSSRVAGLS